MDVVAFRYAYQSTMTNDMLLAFSREGPCAHAFSLPCQSGVLDVQSIVRRVPDRRLVVTGLWQNQRVYAKIFLGVRHTYYAQRDLLGVKLFSEHHIATPAVLYSEIMAKADFSVIIFEEIASAMNAEQAYIHANEYSRLALAKSLLALLAIHHNSNLYQTDLYLKNFLVSSNQLWSLDGDGVRHDPRATSCKRIRYLTILLSKFDPLFIRHHLSVLYEAYAAASTYQISIALPVLAKAVQDFRRKVAISYAYRKVFRTCSDVLTQKNWRFFIACNRYFSDQLHGVTPDTINSALEGSQILKSGQTCTVGLTDYQRQSVVIKRYNIKGLLHALSRAFRPSRAANSWGNAHLLQFYGIATPAPLMLLEKRFLGLRGVAFFVSAYSPWPDAQVFFKQVTDDRLSTEAVKQIATVCYQLFLLKLSHGDMKATNLQITNQGQVILIDLDSMRQHHSTSSALRAHVRDLRRLLQNWKDDTSLYNALLQSFHAVYVDHTPLKLAGISI